MTAIVIAGAGECGTRAAFALREEGWDGPVTLAGAEPSPPYERPPLSKTGELKPICDSGALREAGITFLPGAEAAALDTAAHVLELADGRACRTVRSCSPPARGPGACPSAAPRSTSCAPAPTRPRCARGCGRAAGSP